MSSSREPEAASNLPLAQERTPVRQRGGDALHPLPVMAAQKVALASTEDQNVPILASLAWLILVCISIEKQTLSLIYMSV